MAAVGIEGEIRHHKQLSADISERSVHFTLRVRKDAQPSAFVRKINRVFLRIVRTHAQQEQKTLPDLCLCFAVYCNTRAGYAL